MDIKRMIKDREVRTIIKESWAVGWPTALIMFYEFLIGLTDVYVAGKFGKTVQAAYGFSFQLYFVFIIIGIALSIGVVSMAARLFTSNNKEKFAAAVNSSIVTAFTLGLVCSASGIIFSGKLIGIFNLPEEVKKHAISFMVIYSAAFAFDYVLMSANGLLRACNMATKSFLAMSVACVMNIALDFFLAFKTPLGFKGIAVATVISLFTGMLISLFYVRKLIDRPRFSSATIKEILKISWPSGLLQILWQLGAVVLFLILGALPEHNVEVMAALANGLKIESAIFLPAIAFNMANAVIVGNLLGKRDPENAFRGGIITAVMGLAIVTFLTVAVMFNAGRIAGFLSADGIVINESVRYIYIALIAEPVMAWGIILGGALNGAGDTKSIMAITALSVWLVRIPACYILGIYFGAGAPAIWWSMNLSIVVQAALVTKRYYGRKWIPEAEAIIAD